MTGSATQPDFEGQYRVDVESAAEMARLAKQARLLIEYENFQAAFKLTQPFIIACGLATQEELDPLYEQALQEMTQEDFCAISFGQVVWGKK